ncbi:MAG: hypothetical protein M3301_06780, partial [Chloroflexota bacterium]|nr:hypothetical protein [Chloroflexota bacterium]
VVVSVSCQTTVPPVSPVSTQTPVQPRVTAASSRPASPSATPVPSLPSPAVLRSIALPWKPTRLESDGERVWVISREAGALARIDARGGGLRKAVSLDGTPYALATDGASVFVNTEGRFGSGVVAVHADSLDRRKQVAIRGAWQLAVAADRLWVANLAQGPSWVASYRLSDLGPAGPRLTVPIETVAIASDGRFVWVASHDEAVLTGVDATAGRLRSSVRIGVEPHGLTYAFGDLWIASYHTNELLRVDPSRGRVKARVALPFPPEWLAADDRRVWVLPATGGALSDPEDTRLASVDAGTNRVSNVFVLHAKGTDLAFADGRMWVALESPNSVVAFAAAATR